MSKGYEQRAEHNTLEFKHKALGEGVLANGLGTAFLFEEPADELEAAFDIEVLDDVVGGGEEDEALEDVQEEVVDDAEHV